MDRTAARCIRLMLSAGEASGDAHAAEALNAFKSGDVEVESFGMGAGRLAAAGMELVVDCRDLSVIGIVDVLKNYPRFRRRLATLRRSMQSRRPDLLLLVDYPDFNLKLAETARRLDIPVLFYVSPQVWAWRSYRVSRISRLVSHMAVLFPFEVEVYERAGVPVTYVGNPLVDDARCDLDQGEARRALGIETAQPLLSLLPGSRMGEIQRNLPVMLRAAEQLSRTRPLCRFVLPLAPTLGHDAVTEQLQGTDAKVSLIEGNALLALRASDAALVASGTATLETALIGTPMAIVYVVHPINYAILRRLIRIDDIGLVNIVAGRRVVQEFVQHDATPERLAAELERLLNDSDYRNRQCKALADVKRKLGDGGASGRVAGLMRQLLGLV